MAKKNVLPEEGVEAADGVSTGSTGEGGSTDGGRAEHGFFSWIRGLDLPRGEGWIGGVCAGVAARTGLDPVLVRGIAIVVAVLGGPVVLLYAIAWFLLPGRDGAIHAQELGRGRITRALAGVAGLMLLSFFPLTQGFWYAGALYWGEPDFFASAGRIVWSGVVIVLAVVVIVWIARRAHAAPVRPAAGSAPVAAAEAASASSPPPPEPHTLVVDEGPATAPVGSSPEELAAWQKSQAAWQMQRAQWVAAEDERRRLEVRKVAQEAAAASAERRRIRLLTRPRASAAVVGLVIGVALVAGGIGALVASGSAATGTREWGIGIAVATLAIGLGIVVVGLARRRSGFLAFVGIVGLLATAVGVAVPQDRQLLPPTAYGISSTESGSYAQIGGDVRVFVGAGSGGSGTAPVIDLWKLGGSVSIDLEPGATVQIDLISARDRGYVQINQQDGSFLLGGTLTQTSSTSKGESVTRTLIGPGTEPTAILRVWLGYDGYLSVYSYVDSADDLGLFPISPPLTDPYQAEPMAPVPTESPSPTTTGAP